MMKIKILTILAILVLSIVGVSATAEITYTAENVQSFNALAYDCANEDCSQVTSFSGSLPANTNNGQLKVSFPTEKSQYGYAIYFTTPGYFPKVVRATWYGNGETTRSFQFNKGDVCKAQVNEFTVVNDVVENMPLIITTEASLDATTESAFALNNHPVKYVPESLAEYYKSDVRVTLKITDNSGNVVKQQYVDVKIMAGESKKVEFQWTPQKSGEYVVSISTEVIDDQCESSELKSTSKKLTVLSQAPRNMCYTILEQLNVKTPQQQADQDLTQISVIAKSYYANDYSFLDNNYELTSVKTKITGEVTDENGNLIDEWNSDSAVSGEFTTARRLPPGKYKVQLTGTPDDVLCEGLEKNSETVSTFFTVAQSSKKYSLSFELKDPSGTSIEGASVNLGGVTKTTDENGKVSFANLEKGVYDYTVSKQGFNDASGEVNVDSDKTISLVLEFTEPVENPKPPSTATYDLTFRVLDALTGTPIENVKIVIAGAVGTTGSNGKVVFQGLSNGEHVYTLSHADYESRTDKVIIAGSDLSLTLYLERVTGVTQLPPESNPVVPPVVPKVRVKNSRKLLFVNSIRIPEAFEVNPGDDILLVVNTANKGRTDLRNLRVNAVIQELGVRASSNRVDIDEGDRTTQRLTLHIPENTPKGVQYVRISLNSDKMHRVLYREIEVV